MTRGGWRWVALFVAMIATGPAHAGEEQPGFTVDSASLQLREGVYRLDADIDYRFSAEALEALENGVPLTVAIEIEVRRGRWYWWDEVVASLSQYYLLQFHALSRQYLLTSLNSGAQRGFSSLRGALRAMGRLRDVPILDRKLLDPDARYRTRLRAVLDIESLPSPLRPVAYLSAGWRLQSDWFEWPLSS